MGRSPCCDESGLKKGPWTPEEDDKLIKFIHKHGHASWRALPKLAGKPRFRDFDFFLPDIFVLLGQYLPENTKQYKTYIGIDFLYMENNRTLLTFASQL